MLIYVFIFFLSLKTLDQLVANVVFYNTPKISSGNPLYKKIRPVVFELTAYRQTDVAGDFFFIIC